MQRFFNWVVANATSPDDKRQKIGTTASIVGLATNLLLFILKITIGLISSSVSIMVDAINNLSDGLSSILTLVGFKLAGKPADQGHPYGHQRYEYISGLFVSILILVIGFQFLVESINRILTPSPSEFNTVTLLVLIGSIILKFGQGQFYQQAAQFIDSQTLYASSRDSYNDVIITLSVLSGVVLEYLFHWQIDGYIGLAISLFILYSGISLIKDFVDELLGTRPNSEDIEAICQYIESHNEVIGFHDLLIHQYGANRKFATVHIELDSSWSLHQAHQLLNQIEVDVLSNLGIELVCHGDPVDIQDDLSNHIYRKVKDIIKAISPDLSMHDLQVIQDDHAISLSFDLVVSKVDLNEDQLVQHIKDVVAKQLDIKQVTIEVDRVYLLN